MDSKHIYMMSHVYQLVLRSHRYGQLDILNVWTVNTYQGRCYTTIGGKRPVAKPKTRWNEAVEEDSKKKLGIRNQRTEVLNR